MYGPGFYRRLTVTVVSVLRNQLNNSHIFWKVSSVNTVILTVNSDSYQLKFLEHPDTLALSEDCGHFAQIDGVKLSRYSWPRSMQWCSVGQEPCRSWPLPLWAIKPHLQISWDVSTSRDYLLPLTRRHRWVNLQANSFEICTGLQFFALLFELLGVAMVLKGPPYVNLNETMFLPHTYFKRVPSWLVYRGEMPIHHQSSVSFKWPPWEHGNANECKCCGVLHAD